MKKTLIIVVIGLLVIATIAVIAVFVYMVTKNNASTALPPTLDFETAMAEIVDSFTATPTQPTSTPTEEHTSTPRPTRTRLPTWTTTMTPSPFPTRTPFPSITPTRATEKPGDGLGDATWIDNFETDDYWTLFDDECFKTEISGGKYIQTIKRAPAGACWEVTWPRIQDYYLETVARSNSCDERDRYGFYFRGVDTQRGYLFGITCKGEYWLSFWNSETSQRETLIDYTSNDKINTGSATNKLGVQVTGDRIVLYVNDAMLAEVYDSTYIQPGLIGLFIGAEVTETFSVQYDYLAYWESP